MNKIPTFQYSLKTYALAVIRLTWFWVSIVLAITGFAVDRSIWLAVPIWIWPLITLIILILASSYVYHKLRVDNIRLQNEINEHQNSLPKVRVEQEIENIWFHLKVTNIGENAANFCAKLKQLTGTGRVEVPYDIKWRAHKLKEKPDGCRIAAGDSEYLDVAEYHAGSKEEARIAFYSEVARWERGIAIGTMLKFEIIIYSEPAMEQWETYTFSLIVAPKREWNVINSEPS